MYKKTMCVIALFCSIMSICRAQDKESLLHHEDRGNTMWVGARAFDQMRADGGVPENSMILPKDMVKLNGFALANTLDSEGKRRTDFGFFYLEGMNIYDFSLVSEGKKKQKFILRKMEEAIENGVDTDAVQEGDTLLFRAGINIARSSNEGGSSNMESGGQSSIENQVYFKVYPDNPKRITFAFPDSARGQERMITSPFDGTAHYYSGLSVLIDIQPGKKHTLLVHATSKLNKEATEELIEAGLEKLKPFLQGGED